MCQYLGLIWYLMIGISVLLIMPYTSNEHSDQSVHLHSLVRDLTSMAPL